MTGNFLYVRNLEEFRGKYNESAYTFANLNLYPYFEEEAIQDSDYNNNWLYSFIKILDKSTDNDFYSGKMTIYHIHKISSQLYYRIQDLDSF